MIEFLAQTTQPTITGLDVVKEVSEFFYAAWAMLVARNFSTSVTSRLKVFSSL